MEPLMTTDCRTILLAVDGTEGSDLAVDWALQNYCKPVDAVRLIHVKRPLEDLSRWKVSSEEFNRKELLADVASREIINGYMRKCAKAKIDCGWKIGEGDPREEICKEVLRLCPDVLIVGNNKGGIVKRSSNGSTSQFVARRCACPVIVVKPIL